MIYYYKYDVDGTVNYVARPVPSSVGVEITEEEYKSGIAALEERFGEIYGGYARNSKNARIDELERENAALLFELLTGEAYTEYE